MGVTCVTKTSDHTPCRSVKSAAKRTVLVTGGAGYIGSVAAATLAENGAHVRVVDNLSTGHRDAVHPSCELVVADLRNPGSIAGITKDVETVYHFAAKSLVGESETRPEEYWENNLLGTRNLLEEMRKSGTQRLVFSSTAAVYGAPDQDVIDEDTATRPVNTYGATKLAAEMQIESYVRSHGFAAAILRYFNVAGAHAQYGERHAEETHLIPRMLSGDNPSVFGTDWPTSDGTCVRDYVHVKDLVRAHLLAADNLTQTTAIKLNLGSGCGYSVGEVVDCINRVTGLNLKPARAGRRAGDPPRLVAAVQLAAERLGWRPEYDLEAMIRDAWEFTRRTA